MANFFDQFDGAAQPKGGNFFDQFDELSDGVAKKRSAADIARDVGVTAIKGAVGLPQAFVGLVDIPTGGRVGKALEEVGYRPDDAQKFLDEQYSQQTQDDKRYVQQADGFVDTLGRAIERPATIATAVGESLPSMIGGAGIARGVLKAAPKLAPVIAGAIGEGAIGAGSAAAQIRSENEDGLLTPRQSAIATASGVGTGILGFAGGKLAQKFGLADVDTLLASGAGQASAKGFVRQVVGSGVSEGVFEELPQSMQEQMWQNYATGKPVMEGVGNAGAMGMLAGAAMGGVGGGYNALVGGKPGNQPPPAEQPALAAADALGTPGEMPAPVAQPTEAEKALYTPKSLTALDRVAEIDAVLPNAEPETAATMQAERDSITAAWPKALPGMATSFTTEAGARLDGQYALMEADELTASHDENLRPVATYPAELQPRERERHASEMQIQQIVQRIDPARLGESADVATGAPIVGADGLVESGNARTIALKRVYQASGQKAVNYKDFIKANADRFGIAPEAVDAMRKPVLVRVRATPVNRAEFARQANQSTVARMSPSEQARSDATQIDSLDDLNPTETGEFSSGSSASFVRRFMAKLPATEQSGLIDSTGQLSQAGYQRIRNAVLAKAYGDSPVLQRMVESLDSNVRNVGAALLRVAPQVAKTREAISEGALHNADLTPDLMAAVEELSALKDKGTSVAEALAQAGMFGDKLSPEARDLLAMLDENIRSPRRIAEFIQAYMDALAAAGNPNQGSMFGDTAAPAKVDLIAAARRMTNGQPETTGPTGNAEPAQEDRGQPEDARRDQAGAQGNEGQEWLTFPPDTGTLGIPRAEMPQIKGEHRGALIQFLQGRGISHETVEMPASQLKPTQAEFSTKKVQGWKEARDGVDRSVLASSDGYILDGHHQWVAALAAGETEKVIRFDVPIQELLAAVREFPSVKKSEGAPQKSKTEVRREIIEKQWNEALGDLGAILRDYAHVARMVPENTPNLMPTLVKLFEAGFGKVGMQAVDLMKYVKAELRKLPEFKTIWNKIPQHLYRKAADQAIANIEKAGGADSLFATPTEKVGVGETAMIDGRPYDMKRDNFKPPKTDTFIPADVLARVRDQISRLLKESTPVDISKADRKRAEELLRPMIEKANAVKVEFDQKIIDITKKAGALGQMLTGVKAMDSAVRKLVTDPNVNFDTNQVFDLLRSTIVVKSYANAQAVVDALRAEFNVIPRRIKNQTDQKIEAEELHRKTGFLLSGYGQILVNADVGNGVVAEIQINVPEMLAVKLTEGHDLYEIERTQPLGSATATAAAKAQMEIYGLAVAAEKSRADRKNADSLEVKPLSGIAADAPPTSSPDSSDNLNTRPSGNLTQSPPSESLAKEQPAGNLSGTFISSTSNQSVAQANDEGNVYAAHTALMERLRDGSATLDEFKSAFEAVISGKDAIKAELSAKTKDALLKQFPRLAYRYKSEKKSVIVDAAYRSMLVDFVLGDSIQWNMGQKYEDVIRGYVEKTTEDDLREFADKVKSANEKREARRQEAEAGMENPVTLDDYKRILAAKAREIGEGATFGQARMAMTPEQRARFDELTAEKSRDERKARADQQRTEVRVAATTTDGQIVETKHAKTGEPLFVVKAAERVERDVYNLWNATAKRLGGWYSSYRATGAVPGFQFKTRENANTFLEFIGGKAEKARDAVQARRDVFAEDRVQSAVERLNEMAGRLDAQADEALSAEHKTNTARRARMAAGAETVARGQQAMAQTMRNIATAIESGKAKFLDRVRQKVQVERMQAWLRNARDAELRTKYPSYAEQEKHREAPPTAETSDYAKYPEFAAYRSDLARMGRRLAEIDGAKLLNKRLLKVADDVTAAYKKFAKENLHKVSTFRGRDGQEAVFSTEEAAEAAIARSSHKGKATVISFKRGEHRVIMGPEMAKEAGLWHGDDDKRITLAPDFADEIVAKAKGRDIDMPYTFETISADRARLEAMGIETPAEFRAMLREFVAMREAPKEEDRVKKLEREMIGRKNDGLDFFPTPAETAQSMIDAAELEEGMAVLEPSAGWGHIAEKIREAGVEPDVVELSGDRRELLEAKGFNLVGNDFLDVAGEYDRIIMNPPFGDRRDAEHVRHAFDLLKPGGRLVAIMGEGVFFGQDKKAQDFRDWLESVGGTSEKLPEGSFLDPSLPVNTGVNARMVVVDKPAASEPRLSRRDGPAPVFYSALEKAVPDMAKVAGKDGTIAAEQAKRWLEARQREGKFKADELQWSGLLDWLGAANGRVAVADISAYLEQGGVKVDEVMLGEGFAEADLTEEGYEIRHDPQWDVWDVVDGQGRTAAGPFNSRQDAETGMAEFEQAATNERPIETKFSSYQLPGGENYRELLLTLPVKKAPQEQSDRLAELVQRRTALIDLANSPEGADRRSELMRQARNTSAQIDLHIKELESGIPQFRSSHFDQPNILAHVRFNERADAEGRRVLFIEELQSDWGQKGKKEGFKQRETKPLAKSEWERITEAWKEELAAKWADTLGGMDAARSAVSAMPYADVAKILGKQNELAEFDARNNDDFRQNHPQGGGFVPAAPFVTDTKAWTALALKRMIRYAVDNGFDAVAWTTGEQQSSRYDLSKQIDAVEFIDDGNGGGTLIADKPNGDNALREHIKREQVEDYIGKEAAKKLLESEPISNRNGTQSYVLNNADLKVGGEGMKGYYDAIVPQVARDVLKKVGAGETAIGSFDLFTRATTIDPLSPEENRRVSELQARDRLTPSQQRELDMLVRMQEEAMVERSSTQQPGFLITDAVRQKVSEGMPMFSRGTGRGMALRDLQAVVDRMSPHFKNLPRVHVLESPSGLSTKDPSQKALRDFIRKSDAWNDVEGATHDGEIYLFASGMADEARAEHVLATHEITHYGLRGAVGKELDAALQHVLIHNAKVRKAAAAVKKARGIKSNVEATEEVLADMPSAELAKLTGWRAVVKRVRNWLKKIGAEKLAARLDAWINAGLDKQQQADLFVADLVTAAREWVKTGKGRAEMRGTRLADPTLADDMAKQEKWLAKEAKARGYQSIDELAEKAYPVFENLAALWRKKNPVEEALLSRAPFRAVDVFGNGNLVEHYDDAKGLMFSRQQTAPGKFKWTAWNVFPQSEGGNQVIGEMFAHNSLEDAIASVRGARISAALRARVQAKYGSIPSLWGGEAKKAAKALIDAGIGIEHFASSTQSKSKYIYTDAGTKIRLADHSLPSSYDAVDVDYRYGGDIKEMVAAVLEREGAPTPSVNPDNAGSRSQSVSRNEMQERPAVRADESGSLAEPAQSGGGAGSNVILSGKDGAGKTAVFADAVKQVISDVVAGFRLSMEPAHVMDRTPVTLRAFGWGDLPVSMSPKEIDKVHFDHGMTAERIIRLVPDTLENPSLMLRSATQDGNMVMVANEYGTKPVLLVVKPEADTRIGKRQLVVSMYPKDEGWDWVARQIRSGNLLYRDPKSPVAAKTNGAVTDAQKKFAQAGRPMTGLIPEIGTARNKSGNLSDGYKVLLPSDLRKYGDQGNDGNIRLSRAASPVPTSTPAQRADDIIQAKAGTPRPVDMVLKGIVQATRLDQLTRKLYDKAGFFLDRFTPETIKAGFVADYGIPESVLDKRSVMEGRQRKQLRDVGTLLEKLATLTRAESRVAYEWMNNDDPQATDYFEKQLPEESVKVLKDVRDLIDRLSQEAIRLGQLSLDAYARNKFAYLHRSYIKHTAELTKGETAGRNRALAVLGDQYKGRGMTDAVDMAKVKNVAPEWWGRKLKSGQADKGLKGEKFIRLERRAPTGQGTASLVQPQGPRMNSTFAKGKLLEVAYWPAGEPIPAKLSTWDQAGTWEVRDTKGDKLVVWRDFTKQERAAMGEIDEARYAIAKTLHAMIHDIETGKYLEWLAQNHAKKEGEAIDGEVIEASTSMVKTFKPGEWVKVPESIIPGTKVKKYGVLAGRYLPGPIWNDVRQTVGFRNAPLGETYAAVHRFWKMSKTALSPAVHMNNVMANMVMADWHDVTAGHILKALKLMVSKDQAAQDVWARFGEAGGTVGTFAVNELQKEQLRPLLEALEKEVGQAGEIAGQVGVSAAVQHLMHLQFPAAFDAIKSSKTGQVTAKAARLMLDAYEAEDQVFRLAAWLKAKEDGASDMQAGKLARKSFLDYRINAPWVQMMRGTFLPFIAFTYRAAPMALEMAAKKPWKLMKLGLVAGALNAIGYALSGGDEDDERKLLPEEKAGSVWGITPKLIRMPWNDAHDAPVFLDVRRWIPVGDVLDTGTNHAAFPLIPVAVPGGPLALLAELMFNKSQFTGKEIVKGTDTMGETAEAVTGHLFKSFAPNIFFVPGTYANKSIVDSVKGRTDPFGREQSTGMALASGFGIKAGSYPIDGLRRNAALKLKGELAEVRKNMYDLGRERARGGLSDSEFAGKIEHEAQKIRKLVEGFQRR